jgi:hypothetical protein
MKALFRFVCSFSIVYFFMAPALGANIASFIGGISGSVSAFMPLAPGVFYSVLGGIGRTGIGSRSIYENLFKPTGEGGWGYPEKLRALAIADQLRLEAVVDNSTGFLQFNTQELDGSYPTERRLNRNDHFVAYAQGMYLLKQDVANKKTNGQLHTYPNNTEFGAAYADLMAIYTGGKLNVTVDSKVIHPGYPCLEFLKVPQTQKSAVTNFDQFDVNHSLAEMVPNMRLRGAGTNELVISGYQYQTFAGASAIAGTEHRVVLVFRGFRIRGAESASPILGE